MGSLAAVLVASLAVVLPLSRNSGTALAAGAPTVDVKNGTLLGIHHSAYNQDFFLGIPYAQPPTGDLRFHVPESLNSSWANVRDATQYGNVCYGYANDWIFGFPMNEDCLTLNIVRPSEALGDLPVAVWIYGGAYISGSSRDPRYNLSFIVQNSVEMGKPFIGVSLNYRLQALGFLFGSEVLEQGATNVGLRDQRLALHWIQENINAFGGDPAKVTIWGESAGAISVGTHLLAYGGRDDHLFRAGIEESGNSIPVARQMDGAGWDEVYNNITMATNCSAAKDTLSCLRSVPISQLNDVVNNTALVPAMGWAPVVDNDFLHAIGTQQLQDGQFVKVPLLHGQNFDEGTAFATPGINTDEQFLANVELSGPDNATAQDIANLYPDDPAVGIPATLVGRPSNPALGSQWKRESAYVGDLLMHAPRRLVAQTWAASGLDSWSFNFNVLVNGVPASSGSTHFQEVAFVFNNVGGVGYIQAGTPNPFQGEPASYAALANLMSRMWISFIVDGNPNPEQAINVSWPFYTLESPQNIVFDANATDLAYVQEDTYRASGIQYIIDRLGSVYGR